MKRYRLTKITVKTEEIISATNNNSSENQISMFPFCRMSLSAILPSDQNSAGLTGSIKKPAEFPAAEISENE